MFAGESAGIEAERQRALASAHELAAAEARAAAGRYGIAAVTEKRTMQALAPLAAIGVTFLADRKWPGSRHAQVDLVAIGPQGVFIVDTKAWKDVSIRDERIFRGDEDATESLMALADLADVVEEDMAAIGLAPGEVHAVAVLAGHAKLNHRIGPVDVVGEKDIARYIAGRGTRLTPSQVDAVLDRALKLFPVLTAAPEPQPTVPEPVLAPPPEPEYEDTLLDASDVEAAILDGILAQPIEEWMSFLHPDQAKLVRRSFNGPSRIRGAAGTGKTVVGLHRAAYLARTRPGRVLVTTFVRTLPDVLSSHLRRMAPDVADRVDFMGMHQFALDVLRGRGVTVVVNKRAADAAFRTAWKRVPKDSPLRAKGLGDSYWKDEIAHVIKGRGLTDFRVYADLVRTGRGHVLGAVQRRAVWGLYEDYTRELRSAKVNDFADVILLAEAELRRQPLEHGYAAVIVDEAQDLSCAMVRMLHLIVGDAPDGMTLIGDGQQSVYPGGYTLAEAGISVANRGVVLDINYRNTREVLEFAHTVIAGSEYADIEGEIARGERPAQTPRSGPAPSVVECVTKAELDRLVVRHVEHVQTGVSTEWGDIGVLAYSGYTANRIADALTGAGIPVVKLDKYDGSRVDAVKVGTIKRAKGLEFKQVVVADVDRSLLAGAAPPEEEAAQERWELDRRELYVGMTRARDGLWVGVLG